MVEYVVEYQSALNGTTASSMSICIKLLQRMLLPLFPMSEVSRSLLWEPSANTEEKVKAPIGMKLTQALVNLLFLQDYSISNLGEQGNDLDLVGIESKVVWSSGINIKVARQTKIRNYDMNRCNILSLLLMCIGSSAYQPSRTAPNYFNICLMNTQLNNLKNLFYSLLNTILDYNWQGLGIPYLSTKSNKQEELVKQSLQVLYGLIEFVPLSLDRAEELMDKDVVVQSIAECMQCDATGLIVNEYSRLVCQIEGEVNYELLFKGITKLLTNYIASSNSVLPASVKRLDCFVELLVLFLRLIILNPVLLFIIIAFLYLYAY
jgi:hypothetical protein